MSIEKQHGKQTLICDECEDDLGESYSDFGVMIAHAKSEGWQIKPDGEGGWTHTCADCKGGSGGLAAQRALFGR